jgi:O-antigen ligase
VALLSATQLPFLDLREVLGAVGSATGMQGIQGLLDQVAGVASVRYVVYALALVIGLRLGHAVGRPRSAVTVLLFGYCLWAMVSSLWASRPLLVGMKALALLGVALLAVALCRRPGGSEEVIALTIGAYIALAVLTVTVAIMLPEYGLDPHEGWYPRLGGQLLHANELGEALGILVLLLLSWPLAWGRSLRMALVVGVAMALLATQSRTSIVATIAGIAVITFVRAHVGGRALCVLLACVAAVVGLVLDVDPGWVASHAGRGSAEDVYDTIVQRIELWQFGIREGARALLLGNGFGVGSRGTLVEAFAWRPAHAHNALVEVFLNLGLVGVMLMLGLLVCSGIAVLRRIRAGGVAALEGRTLLGVLTFLLVLGFAERGIAGELSSATVGLVVVVAVLGAPPRMAAATER